MEIYKNQHHLSDDFKSELQSIVTKYKSKAGAAKAVYRVLRKICTQAGMDPNCEVGISPPKWNEEQGYSKAWSVSFEAGDYDWAIPTSFVLSGKNWYTEPYHGFDLFFHE